jgi:proteic killer suppression protein
MSLETTETPIILTGAGRTRLSFFRDDHCMDVEFTDPDLDRLEVDLAFNAGLSRDLVRAFRKVMQLVRSAPDERTLYAFKSLRFEKLKGDRQHQRSLRLNDQWRLILEIRPAEPKNVIIVIAIEDYH